MLTTLAVLRDSPQDMRVLHVIDSLAGSGGAEQGMVREVTRFSDDLEQRVVLLYDRQDLRAPLAERGIPIDVVGLAEGSGSRTWPRAVSHVRRLIAEWAPDVIQSSLFLGNLVAQLAARRQSVPVVSNLVLSGDIELLRNYQPGAGTRKAALLRKIAGWAARRENVWFRALDRGGQGLQFRPPRRRSHAGHRDPPWGAGAGSGPPRVER